MSREERELVLSTLREMLPYGVIILHESWNYEWDDSLSTWERVVDIDDEFVYTKVIDSHTKEEYRDDLHTISLFDDKPILRDMEDMTYEEVCEYWQLAAQDKHKEWLKKNHFNYNFLPEYLYMKVDKEYNPYE